MAEQIKKPSSAKQKKPRASQSKKSSTAQSKKPGATRSTSNSSAARSGSKKPASAPAKKPSTTSAAKKTSAARSAPGATKRTTAKTDGATSKRTSQSTSSSRAKAKPRAARSVSKGPADKVPAISKAQVEEQSERYKRKADKYRNDPKKTEELLKEAEKKARKNPGPISARLQDLATLLRLVRAYFSKEYTEVPWETIALAIGAIAYFVSPIDLIPDFIPVAGYLDDAAVIGFVIASAANDLHNFREWEAHQQLGT